MIHKARVNALQAYMRERYNILLSRNQGHPWPWTDDPTLRKYHFCNVYRRDDKVSRVIYALMRKQRSAQDKLRASVVGRHQNHHLGIPHVWTAVQTQNQQAVVQALHEVKFNTAYRIRMPTSLYHRPEIATLMLADLNSAAARLRKSRSMQDAADNAQSITNSPFILYQILLDLNDNGFFPQPFDESNWMFMAGGCWRGLSYLLGEYTYTDNKIEDKWDLAPSDRERPRLEAAIAEITHILNRTWPHALLTVHDTEFNLCEFDKYNRYRTAKTGRIKTRLYHQSERT